MPDQSALTLPVHPDHDPLLDTFIPWFCVGDGCMAAHEVLMATPRGPGGGLRLGIHLLSERCHFRDLPTARHCPVPLLTSLLSRKAF